MSELETQARLARLETAVEAIMETIEQESIMRVRDAIDVRRDHLAIDVDLRDRYGYARRDGQSTDYITVPAALLEEARDSCGSGDAQSLLIRALEKGVRR